jgi:uncharacterized protein
MPTLTAVSDDIERRFIAQPVEVRGSGGQKRVVGGYAAVFNKRSQPLPFTEIVTPTFFRDSQSNGFAGVVCRYNHSDLMLLGAVDSGTLRLNVDPFGLDYEVDLPECRSDVWELVQRKDLRNSSFAFQVTEDSWGYDSDGNPVRSLISGRILDVAPVPRPAYPEATVALRSFSRHFGVPFEDVEEYAERNELRKFYHSGSRSRPSMRKRPTKYFSGRWS